MSAVSMLVPLQQTLEGWPESPVPSISSQLLVYLAGPAVLTLLIVVYVVITQKREKRLLAQASLVEPLWLGGGEHRGPMLETGYESATSSKTAALRAKPEDESTGGSSARW